MDSLTINYEFTRTLKENEEYNDWKYEQNRINPFWRANSITPIKRIEFEIKLTDKSHSLAYAFYEFEKLEYINAHGPYLLQGRLRRRQPHRAQLRRQRRIWNNNHKLHEWHES